MEEAFAPQAHDIATDGKRSGDLVVATAFGREQDDLGAQHFEI